jgi:NAD(P)-dependent dehydrogenase (short-subunit alcohol dehydrogenase family)
MANYLIVAATSQIGTCIVEKLLASGHQLFVTGRDSTKLAAIAEKHQLAHAVLDASDFVAVEAVFQQAKTEIGPLHGVVNCAGSLLLKSAHTTKQAEYEQTLVANLTTAFAVVSAAGKHLASEGGSVVLMSSAAAMTGIPNHEAIAAAKAGIIGLARSAAATYASNQIRFNVVAPGLVETTLTSAITNNPLARKASEGMHALGRLGSPEDIAAAVIFFLNPENTWITGQVLAVDGGLSSVKPKMKV